MITWSITPARIQYGTESVQLVATGLQPNEVLIWKVATPTEPAYSWKVKADASGIISETLLLSSGPGRYNFTAPDCHEFMPLVQSVVACCCAPYYGVESESLELFVSPARVQAGNLVQVDVTGGPPQTKGIIFIHHDGATEQVAIAFDALGVATYQHQLQTGAYAFQAAATGMLTTKQTAFGVGDINSTAPIDTNAGLVSIRPAFLDPAVAAGSSVALVITVTNASDQQVEVTGSISLPSWLTSILPVAFAAEPVAARSSRDFTFFCVAVNLAETEVTQQLAVTSGTYTLAGVVRPAVLGTATLTIAPTQKPCGLQVVFAGFQPARIVSGQAALFVLKVRNIGGAALSNVALGALGLPSQLAGGPVTFSGVPLKPGADYTFTRQVLGTSSTPVDLVVTVPVGQVSAVCQSRLVVNTAVTTANLRIG